MKRINVFLTAMLLCIALIAVNGFTKGPLTTKHVAKISGGNQSLTGGGTAVEQDYSTPPNFARTTVSINAIKKDNGTVNGNLEYNYRAGGLTFHANIDCLIITGNIASVSGTITRVGGKNAADWINYFPGQRIQISIQDNGSGDAGNPDVMSDLNRGPGVNCSTPLPDGPYIPIQGNFTIHQ